MLTEQEIAKNWRGLFQIGQYNENTLEKAEALLDELRPESPLRHRLGSELAEIRKLRLQQS